MRTTYPFVSVLGFGAVVAILSAQTGPTEDRIGFPQDYEKNMKVLYVFDRADNKQVRTIYANDHAFVQRGQQGSYPYGSILVMETWRALQDAQGNPILDSNGRYQKDPVATPTIFVMKKGKGFGEAYGSLRNGEWEYVAYRPNGTYQTTPQNSFACAQCHLQAGGAKDWVFRASLNFNGASGALPTAVVKSYTFVPGLLRVKAGSWVTFYNDDVVEHTITDDWTGGGTTGRFRGGSSVGIRFDHPGEFNFHCDIHPTMKGRIIVEP